MPLRTLPAITCCVALLAMACRPERPALERVRAAQQTLKAEEVAAVPARAMGVGTLHLTEEQRAIVLAKGDGVRVTAGDFADALARLPVSLRVRYQNPERHVEFLRDLLAFEVLTRAAVEAGMGQDALVLQDFKRGLADAWLGRLAEEAVTPGDIPDEAVAAAYAERTDIGRVETMIRAYVLAGDMPNRLAEARKRLDDVADDPDRVVARLKDMIRTHGDPDLGVGKTGDAGFITAKGFGTRAGREIRMVPEELAAAIFATPKRGTIIGPMATPRGFMIGVPWETRPGFRRPLDEIRHEVRNLLVEEGRARWRAAKAAELAGAASVSVDEAAFAAAFPDQAEAAPAKPPAKGPRPKLAVPLNARGPVTIPNAERERLRKRLEGEARKPSPQDLQKDR